MKKRQRSVIVLCCRRSQPLILWKNTPMSFTFPVGCPIQGKVVVNLWRKTLVLPKLGLGYPKILWVFSFSCATVPRKRTAIKNISILYKIYVIQNLCCCLFSSAKLALCGHTANIFISFLEITGIFLTWVKTWFQRDELTTFSRKKIRSLRKIATFAKN